MKAETFPRIVTNGQGWYRIEEAPGKFVQYIPALCYWTEIWQSFSLEKAQSKLQSVAEKVFNENPDNWKPVL